MMALRDKTTGSWAGSRIVTGVLALMLSACGQNTQISGVEGINFRETRYQEVTAMRGFRVCRDEALQLDTQARANGDPARYRASAELLERCESDLGPEAAGISREERMRAYGLSIQNLIKSGDMPSARENLARFKQAYPDHDFYYADGSSFVHTMEALLSQKEPSNFGTFSPFNVSHAFKAEMRRMEHWKLN